MLLEDFVNHPDECARVELGLGGNFGARDAESKLEVFLVADQNVHMLHDAIKDRHRSPVAARDVPELGAVIEVEGNHGADGLGRLHAFDDHFGGGW